LLIISVLSVSITTIPDLLNFSDFEDKMSINEELAVGALPGHAGVPTTSSMRLEDGSEAAGLEGVTEAPPARGEGVTEAPPARGDDVSKLAAACGGEVTGVAAVDRGDVAEAALVGGDVAKASDMCDDIESPPEKGNKNETEVTFFCLFWRRLCHCDY
jgi:hypothetical protein